MEHLSMMGSSSRATVGEPAPRFECRAIIDGRIKDLSLRDIMANKQWTLLNFFPMAWSFICPTEILAFDSRLAEFSSRGCAVIFVSTDSEHVLKAWNAVEKEEGGLGGVQIPLMSDRNHRLSREYGVLVEEQGVAQRAIFFIDPLGIIRATSVNDANVGRSIEEAKRMLDALKFTDDYGEGCPVDWKTGDKTIKMAAMELSGRRPDPISIAAAPTIARPGMNRGLSWTSGWVKSPRENYLGARPKSLLWANEEAVASNDKTLMGSMSTHREHDYPTVAEV